MNQAPFEAKTVQIVNIFVGPSSGSTPKPPCPTQNHERMCEEHSFIPVAELKDLMVPLGSEVQTHDPLGVLQSLAAFSLKMSPTLQ